MNLTRIRILMLTFCLVPFLALDGSAAPESPGADSRIMLGACRTGAVEQLQDAAQANDLNVAQLHLARAEAYMQLVQFESYGVKC